ncbi:hypothetical protein [Aureimonas sp. N4]|uniref:hypothetical protein n=1 Tax=Aureimonas sp. N4 TaxID=1638165 RepID=UPI00078319DE|nr:hypothetical protein [Aureimonas sp. N4]
MTSASLPAQNSRLAECEKVIEKGLSTFVDVGNALVEIRDDKLYRETHQRFEDYCRDRWDLGRARAYQLIDHARTVAAIKTASGVCLPAVDISERDTRDIKADLPAVVEEIKARVAVGELPSKAAADAIQAKRDEKAEERRQREAEAAERLRVREEQKAQLSPDVRQRLEHQQSYRKRAAESDAPSVHRIAELEDELAASKAEIEALKTELVTKGERIAELSRLEVMETLFNEGGFEAVIAAKDRVLWSKDAMIRTQGESLDKWKNECLSLRKRLKVEQPSSQTIIDMQSGEIRNA